MPPPPLPLGLVTKYSQCCDLCPDWGLATYQNQISIQMRAHGLFKIFVNIVQIGSWPFSKIPQNLSGLVSGLSYHYLGSYVDGYPFVTFVT